MNNISLSVRNLSVFSGTRTILDNISFDLKGGVTGILGKNGAGKTTLIKALAGITDLKTTGEIHLFDKNGNTLSASSHAKHISYVPQTSGDNISISVLDFVLLGRSPHLGFLCLPSAKDIETAKNAMKKLNITHLESRSFSTLSGGERKLCRIARALCTGADTALLDEPCSELDFGRSNEFMMLLSSGLFTYVLVSMHDPNLAFKYCDRVIILDEKKIQSITELDGSDESNEKYIYGLHKLYGESVSFSGEDANKTIIWK